MDTKDTVTPVLSGEAVLLRPLHPSDQQKRQSEGWHASIERNYGSAITDREMTDAEASEWFTHVRDIGATPFRWNWIIEVDDRVAGFTSLSQFNPPDPTARFAIGMFHPDFQGRGLGTDATLTVLRHAFTTMGLHRVDLRVLDFNQQAQAMYAKCGFRVEGRERETCQVDGRWCDDIVMGILDREYHALIG